PTCATLSSGAERAGQLSSNAVAFVIGYKLSVNRGKTWTADYQRTEQWTQFGLVGSQPHFGLRRQSEATTALFPRAHVFAEEKRYGAALPTALQKARPYRLRRNL